jgi:hypothetical protein
MLKASVGRPGPRRAGIPLTFRRIRTLLLKDEEHAMKPTPPPDMPPVERHDRLIRERIHDPYLIGRKPAEPTVCRDCGALYHRGRWQWGSPPAAAEEALCPACLRVRDRCPAGFLTLSGEFFAAHRDEILRLVHHVEAREKASHALKRLMAVADQGEGRTLATFTDPDLARAVGEAIAHAYQGELDFVYPAGEFLLRVNWSR